ncbi:hypothetical protein FHG87_002889 [Trinorchestia longiramus]|nr:hypothetical protein FHG87_002889 [Trinorchestia longiramus]
MRITAEVKNNGTDREKKRERKREREREREMEIVYYINVPLLIHPPPPPSLCPTLAAPSKPPMERLPPWYRCYQGAAKWRMQEPDHSPQSCLRAPDHSPQSCLRAPEIELGCDNTFLEYRIKLPAESPHTNLINFFAELWSM